MRYALFTIPLALLLALGCGTKPPEPAKGPADAPKPAHDHGKEGPHGGALAEWGDHEYHVEFTVDHDAGQATAYILDGEAKGARAVPAAQVTLTLKLTPPVTVNLRPSPQPGDATGSASVFVGTHDALKRKQEFSGTVSAQLGAKKFSGDFQETPHEGHAASPGASPNGPTQRETDLFLKPGGLYTQADIEKNGNTVPSVKYRGVSFEHDDNLNPGDRLCPITVNKADEKCVWWVNGKEYQFCCPPCLEKFVKQAKESPEKIKDPAEYIKK